MTAYTFVLVIPAAPGAPSIEIVNVARCPALVFRGFGTNPYAWFGPIVAFNVCDW